MTSASGMSHDDAPLMPSPAFTYITSYHARHYYVVAVVAVAVEVVAEGALPLLCAPPPPRPPPLPPLPPLYPLLLCPPAPFSLNSSTSTAPLPTGTFFASSAFINPSLSLNTAIAVPFLGSIVTFASSPY